MILYYIVNRQFFNIPLVAITMLIFCYLMETFTSWMHKELKARDWSQADLARRCKITTATISRIMNGERNPGTEVCTAIAKAFKMSPETVFRVAGLLPPANPEDESIDRLTHRINQLTPEEQSLVDDLIETLLTRREFRARKAQQQTPEPDTP